MSIKISTLNIFTLNEKNKIMFVRDFIKKYKIDICFIQKTHIQDVSLFNFIEKLFLYDFYSTISSDNTRGVAIFIRKERGLKVLNEYFNTENTVHGIEVCFKNKNYNFINIYSPTSSYNQCEFIQNLYTLLSSKKNIFTGGDFNYIEDREYERNNNKLWKTFFKNYNLCEFEWSVPNSSIKECYIWS